jgi:hypothetical protein
LCSGEEISNRVLSPLRIKGEAVLRGEIIMETTGTTIGDGGTLGQMVLAILLLLAMAYPCSTATPTKIPQVVGHDSGVIKG